LARQASDFQRKWFLKFEEALHQEACGPRWLKDERVATIVADALHYRDGSIYRLDAYCIMSNHVHTVFTPFLSSNDICEVLSPEGTQLLSRNPPLDRIMFSLKGYTAYESNRVLGRKGPFWQPESYDHVVRNAAAYDRIVRYVLNNPVKIGLVKQWQDWKWNYRRETPPQ
jgi:putative transposase